MTTVIYIVEDDSNIRQMESYALRNSGYEVAECSDGEGFWALCRTALPELVVLDIMLPGEDGLAILRRLREDPATRRVPVIIISAKSTELDTVTGLDTGADDYITKPFGVMELISRVKAMLRRTEVHPENHLALGGILLDDDKRQVFADGQLCPLTFKEHELLKCLLLNQGIVLTREKMMNKVWGTDFAGESRTVDMHIKTLRQKLGSCGNMIRTVRNVGYKIEE